MALMAGVEAVLASGRTGRNQPSQATTAYTCTCSLKACSTGIKCVVESIYINRVVMYAQAYV